MDLKEISEGQTTHPWELSRMKVVSILLREYLIDDSYNIIVDIGCGNLFFIDYLSKEYPNKNFFAIDTGFNEDTINLFRDKYAQRNISIHRNLEEIPSSSINGKTIVLLMDVLEHVQDDLSFLNYIQRFEFIANDSIFMITVPAFQSLYCYHDEFLGHYRRYNSDSISKVMIKAGLKIQKKGYFFFTLIFARLLQVIMEKLKKNKKTNNSEGTGLSFWTGGKIKTAILKTILLFDFKMVFLFKKIGINIIGLSNYVICKKYVL